jgi:hypothetical protein
VATIFKSSAYIFLQKKRVGLHFGRFFAQTRLVALFAIQELVISVAAVSI